MEAEALMTVVSIEGDVPITAMSDPGPTFLRVRVNLNGQHGESWFALEHADPMPKIGDVYRVIHGRQPVSA